MEGTSNPGFIGEEEKGGSGAPNLLSVGAANSEMNAHTYVYDANKSLRKMTMEVLPNQDLYKGLDMHSEDRPTIDELMVGKMEERQKKEEELDTRKGKVIKFGWIEGVLMRCLLNIWGTMLFLRLTWVVGQCGIWQGVLCITLCNAVTAVSALSMSAISTNGQIAAGGVYYMISRALGPALGGSIGLMFTVANTISVGTYTVGFATSVSDLLQDAVPGWDGIVDHGCRVAGCRDNDIRIIGAPTLCLFLFIAFAGMDWVTRIQKLLLVFLILAQCDMFIGSILDLESGTFYVQKDSEGGVSFLEKDQRHAYGYESWSTDVASVNWGPNYNPSSLQQNPDFMATFGVFFTAVTGIVAGANLSGDLKDPSMSIPRGTLLAIALTYVTYTYFAIQTGFVFRNKASGIAEEYRFHQNNGDLYNLTQNIPDFDYPIPKHYDCSDEANAIRDTLKFEVLPQYDLGNLYEKWNTNGAGVNDTGSCTFGSSQNQMTMTYVSFTGWLRYIGGFSASLSSAIASLVGAPRILQAVGKDGLYPFVGWFEKGYNANNDPYRGYILCFFGAMACVMIAKLNAIGVLASNFFLAAYGLMNLSCFHSSYSKSPGWRPGFKYYNMWVSLVGAVVCVVIMFLLDWRYAVATVGIQAVLGAYIYIAKPEANWGSSAQALTVVNAIDSAQVITNEPDHVKTYRPKILLLAGNPAHRPALVDFANLLTKKISVLITGHILTEQGPVNLYNLKEGMQAWLKDHNIKGFYAVTQTPDLSGGARSAMSLAGLGKLSPNMVMVGFKNNWKEDLVGLHHHTDIMFSAFELNHAFAILRCKGGFDYSNIIASEQQIVKEVPVTKDDSEDEGEANKNSLSVTQPEKPKTRKVSTAVFRDTDGNRLDNSIVQELQQFQVKQRKGHIDVWWLYDDGGLTLLLPHILKTRKQFKDCKLRVFSLANKADELDAETINLASMLKRFRIDYSDVTAMPDVTKKADPETKKEFETLIAGTGIEEAELQREREKTNRHLRLTEMLRQYSTQAELVIMTLPLPRRDQTSPALYTAWLDIMSKDLPPTLFVRGNQQNVLTFYA